MERILQVVTYMGRGGIETMLMNYYRQMDRTKIQFDFLVHRDFRADFDDEIESLGGHIYRIPPMNPMSHSYRKALKEFFKSHKYHIVHCHLNHMSGVVLSVAKKAGVPIRIAHAHTASMTPGWKQAVRRLYKHIIPFVATHRFACSYNAAKSVFGKYSFLFMANAIDVSAFATNENVRTSARSVLDLNDSLTVIHVGRMVYAKNHTFLLDAFKTLTDLDPNVKLILVGDGELRTEIEAHINNILPKCSVLILGTRADIPNLLQAADVFAFPSRFEGLPVTVIEAQAAGLPCIKSDTVTDECVVTDLVKSLPIDDPRAWAEAILAAKNTPRTDRSEEIKSAGYDIVSAAKKLEHFYLEGSFS